MIESPAPPELPLRVAPVCEVGRSGVQPGSRSLADEVHDKVGADEAADLIARSHPAVVDDDVDFGEAQTGLGDFSP